MEEAMNDYLDTEREALARDMSWHCAMAQHSDGLATFYVCADELTGELFYRLVRARKTRED
jgi:hypothetical protein